MTVRLLSKLPDRDSPINGLEPYGEQIVRAPGAPRVAVVVLRCDSTEVKTASGARNPAVQIAEIEIMDEATDVELALSLLHGARERRSGQTALPILADEKGVSTATTHEGGRSAVLVRSAALDSDAPF